MLHQNYLHYDCYYVNKNRSEDRLNSVSSIRASILRWNTR